jgi:hypothetical protein
MTVSHTSEPSPTVAQIYQQTRSLSTSERKELVKLLIDTLDTEPATVPVRSLRELRGLGKEIWTDVDAQEYVDQLRDEWDEHV